MLYMQICTNAVAVNQNHSLNICPDSSGDRFLTSTTRVKPDGTKFLTPTVSPTYLSQKNILYY